MTNSFVRIASLLTLSAFTLGCQQEDTIEVVALDTPEAIYAELPAPAASFKRGKSGGEPTVAIAMAEYITLGDAEEVGNRIFFNDRGNKQLDFDFAPGTSFDGTDDVSFYIDPTRPSNELPVATSTDALRRATLSWDEATCSELGMYEVPATGEPTGFVSNYYGFGGSYDYVADVTHNGWLPGTFFKQVFGNRGNSVVGVTFTLEMRDRQGRPVDANNDGKADVAWREIYYNDRFNWATSIDAETIALHEVGHGLSQGHFGKGFKKAKTGEVHYSPRAVMNAVYSGVNTSVEGTDNSGHCSIWANWPNK